MAPAPTRQPEKARLCFACSRAAAISELAILFHGVREVLMKIYAALLGALVLGVTLSSVTTPALALGGCGPNAHRGPGGVCLPGGQNQDWCIRKTGHPATRMPDGTLRC